jgi:protein gp37
MSQTSGIEWTDATWNPVTGCTKITAGCDFCYAERFAERFRGVVGHPYENGFDLQLRPERLNQPLSWRRPRQIFVNSMSDLFHKEVPEAFVHQVFDVMEKADWHIFQLLTKRSSLMRDFVNKRYTHSPVPAHIWLGVSVEDKKGTARINHLRQTNADIRFLSVEPLIEEIDHIDLTNIHWVIVGGESGQQARPMKKEWAAAVRNMCVEQDVPFFFKQWGTWSKNGIKGSKSENGRYLDGRKWNEMPFERMNLLRKKSSRGKQTLIPVGG